MANVCDNTMVVHCEDQEALRGFHNILKKLDESKGYEIRLCDLLQAYGIDYLERRISVRGGIYHYELDEENNSLTIGYESAWCPQDEAFEAINEKMGDCFTFCTRSIEPGCGIFSVVDSMGDFPEECYVDAAGPLFDDLGEQTFDTIAEAVNHWCSLTKVSRDGRDDYAMIRFIEDYEYEDEDNCYYIHPFDFE